MPQISDDQKIRNFTQACYRFLAKENYQLTQQQVDNTFDLADPRAKKIFDSFVEPFIIFPEDQRACKYYQQVKNVNLEAAVRQGKKILIFKPGRGCKIFTDLKHFYQYLRRRLPDIVYYLPDSQLVTAISIRTLKFNDFGSFYDCRPSLGIIKVGEKIYEIHLYDNCFSISCDPRGDQVAIDQGIGDIISITRPSIQYNVNGVEQQERRLSNEIKEGKRVSRELDRKIEQYQDLEDEIQQDIEEIKEIQEIKDIQDIKEEIEKPRASRLSSQARQSIRRIEPEADPEDIDAALQILADKIAGLSDSTARNSQSDMEPDFRASQPRTSRASRIEQQPEDQLLRNDFNRLSRRSTRLTAPSFGF